MRTFKFAVFSSLLVISSALAADEDAVSCDPVLQLRAEAEFIGLIPNLATENLNSTFENFETEDSSAARAAKLARDLVELKQTSSAGLFLHGPVGSGKSHLAVAAARWAHQKKLRVLYLTPPGLTTYRRTRLKAVSPKGVTSADLRARLELNNQTPTWSAPLPIGQVLKKYDLLVIDDLNAKDVLPEFAAIVTYAHRADGLRLLVASNLPLETLFARSFPQDAVARARFVDRFQSIFETHELNGPSRRPKTGWARD